MDLTPVQLSDLQVYCSQLSHICDVGVFLETPSGEMLASTRPNTQKAEASRETEVAALQGQLVRLRVEGSQLNVMRAYDFIAHALRYRMRELALCAQNDRYEAFLDCAADWFWETDEDNRFIYLSGKVEEILGCKSEDIIGKTRFDLYRDKEDFQSPYWQSHIKCIENRESFSDFQVTWRQEGRKNRYLNLSGRPYYRSTGEFAGYRGTGIDVTDRIYAQTNFRNLVEGSIQGISIHRKWKFLFVNHAMAQICGYENAEDLLKVNSVKQIIAPHDLERLRSYRLARERGENVEGRHVADFLKKNGEVVTLESINSLIEWNGEPAILSTVIDVTEQKNAQRKLQRHRDHLQEMVEERSNELIKSEERFRNIAEISSDWFWESDEHHRFLSISERFFDATGVKPEEVMGKSRVEFAKTRTMQGDDAQMWVQHLEDLNSHRPISMRYRIIGGDGQERSLEIKGKPLFDGDGKFTGYLGSGRNVTEEVKAQEALKIAVREAENANRAKSDFLSHMSHELRTPLNAILGFSQLLESNIQGNLSDGQVNQLAHIRKGGEHLLQLIDEILDLAKIEAGKLSINLENVDLSNLVHTCLPYASSFAEKYEVEIIDNSAHNLPFVYIDPLRTKQALLNLLSNASKYNRPGGKIWIETQVLDDGYLRVSIRDNGIGISKLDSENMFKPFQRLKETADHVEGTGIGLVLTRKLIEEMGGRIDYESSHGVGSTFWLDLPLVAHASCTPSPKQFFQGGPMPICAPSNQRTLLYIEDNPSNLSLMEGVVDYIPNVRMISAHTAELGISLARREMPDLILLDVNLPGMDGLEAVRQIKQDAILSEIPVFAVSADAMLSSVKKGLEAGFDQYLTKPIDVAKFLAALKEVFH